MKEWLKTQPGAEIRLLGVGVGGLTPAQQFDLFAASGQTNANPLDDAIDKIREKFGEQSLTRASRKL